MIILVQNECQRFILKLHSSRIAKAGWDLTLPLADARKNEEVISLASSQLLRWIDELNGVTDADAKAKAIKKEIREIKKEPNSPANKKRIKALYNQLDELQYKPDYINIMIDKSKHYYRLCKGFKINGIEYVRLFATVGGVKTGTVSFISKRLAPEIFKRVNNGRDMTKTFSPAKLQAYLSLICSGSIPVSMPNGVAVVSDLNTEFVADVIYLNSDVEGEPTMTSKPGDIVSVDASDGFGLILPSLAERWSMELGLDYVSAGFNTRNSFEKGMVFTFDFLEFAEYVSGSYIIKDIWGNDVDVRNIEMILTESMLKLWSSYASYDEYLRNCEENKYTYCVTKTCPKSLESERALNYQFIQSYKLSSDDIDELISPTTQMFDEVLSDDWAKAVLFLKGIGLDESNIQHQPNNYVKAMMIEPSLFCDSYVSSAIYELLKNRINEAKVGVLNVHGNYSIASGDPYALCQHIFELPVTGLLSANSVYNRFWADTDAEALACYRAPMSCHNNIRKVYPCRSEEVNYWYRYMNTCTVFSCWSPEMIALNGMDFDGDIVMLTDNNVLVSRLRELPALVCSQKNAAKIIPEESDYVRSDLNTFGNDIGKVTNYITSMYEVQSYYKPGSEEYDELEYRIQCGQQHQQDTIDRAKGIISKPMSKVWYDWHEANAVANPALRRLCRAIVADRKPYFMIYIYPALKKQYNVYTRNANRNAMREFGMTVEEMKALPYVELDEAQREFIRAYDFSIPVGVGKCVMNEVCRKIESKFDGFVSKHRHEGEFDYTLLKSNVGYSKAHYNAILSLYNEYTHYLQSHAIAMDYIRSNEDEDIKKSTMYRKWFMQQCELICPNEDSLCDILVDICYKRSGTKKLVWDVCSEVIVRNLLKRNNGIIYYPTLDKHGDITYCGSKFSIKTGRIDNDNEYYSK